MGYHSGLNGEYSSNIPVKVNNRHTARFKRCCKEEVPEEAIKVETYLKDDTIYFVLPSNYKPVKICFDAEGEPFASPEGVVYGGKGNQKLNVDFRSTGQGLCPRTPGADSTGYYQNDDYVNISDSTNYAQPNNIYTSIFDSLLDLNNQINAMGCNAEDAEDALCNLFDKLYNK